MVQRTKAGASRVCGLPERRKRAMGPPRSGGPRAWIKATGRARPLPGPDDIGAGIRWLAPPANFRKASGLRLGMELLVARAARSNRREVQHDFDERWVFLSAGAGQGCDPLLLGFSAQITHPAGADYKSALHVPDGKTECHRSRNLPVGLPRLMSAGTMSFTETSFPESWSG
jgi:hypothetical protein